MKLRIEGTHPPKYVEGYRVSDGQHNYAVDEGTIVGIYIRTGEQDGEPVYRRVGGERTA